MFCSKLWHWCEKRLGRQSPVMLHHSIDCVACTTDLPLLDIMCCVLGTFVAASRTGLLEAWLKAACRGHSQCRCCTGAFPCAPAPRIRDGAVAGSSRGMAKLAYTHTFPFNFQSSSVLVLYVSSCFIMFHHVSSCCIICQYFSNKFSSFFCGFHRVLPAMLWETCSLCTQVTTGDSRLWIRSFPGQDSESQW